MKLIEIIDNTPIRYGYRIAFLANFYREPLIRKIEKEFGIIRPEWTVLICLMYRDGLNSRDICEITEQPSNTVSRGVSSLVGKNLIRTEPDPVDARRTILQITQEGQAIYERIMPLFVERETKLLASLNKDEIQLLDGLLDKLSRDVTNWS